MAASGGNGSGPITSINVTPLVDVTLVLLIVFLVTAKLIVNRHALELDLPRAATGAQTDDVFGVTLFSDGRIELGGIRLPNDDSILERARLARHATPGLRAVIRAEATVPHGRVVGVLDRLRRTGVSKIAFGVVPEGRHDGRGEP